MTVIAGMDLGYGSQVQLVKTNYLIAGVATNGTPQAMANLLQLYNDTVDSAIKADYIACVNDNGTSVGTAQSPTTGDAMANVIDTGTLTNWPVMGPSASVLSTQAGTTSTHDADADAIGTSANGHILSVLSVSMMDFGADFAAGAHIITSLGSERRSLAELVNGRLMVAQVGGPTSHLNLTDVIADILEAGTLNGVATLSLVDADLNASFVQKGNAAGTTATVLSDVGDVVADTCALLSVVSLVRAA
jgi:hypothetical protein